VQVFAECFRSIAIFNDVLEWKPGSVSPADLGFKDIFLDQQEGHASPHVNILVFLEGAAHYLRKPSRPGLKGLLWTSHRSALTTICPYQKNAGHLTVAMSKSRGRIQYFYNDKVVLVNVFYGDKKTLHEVAKLDDAKQFSESLVQAFGGETDLALAAVESLKTTLGDPLNLGGAA